MPNRKNGTPPLCQIPKCHPPCAQCTAVTSPRLNGLLTQTVDTLGTPQPATAPMTTITLNTTASLTGLSKRTLWRRVADGQLHAQGNAELGEHSRVRLDEVLAISRIHLDLAADGALIAEADAGVPEAQCDLGLEFLMQGLPTEAVAWFTLSAQQNEPEAIHQLGRCYIAGQGVAADEAQGVALITRAAALGHFTAKPMARYLMDPERPPLPPAELEAKLDEIEKRVVLGVLRQTGTG